MNITDTLPPWGLIATGESTLLSFRPISEREAQGSVDKHTVGHYSSEAIGQLVDDALTGEGQLIPRVVPRGAGAIAMNPNSEALLVMSSNCELSWFVMTRHEVERPDSQRKAAATEALKNAEKHRNGMAILSGYLVEQLGNSPESLEVAEAVRKAGETICHGILRLSTGYSPAHINEEIWPGAPARKDPSEAAPTLTLVKGKKGNK